jgi:hypothetical protein
MSLPHTELKYENHHKGVSWRGVSFVEEEEFTTFLRNDVADRLNDTSEYEKFQHFLKGLELTGLGIENLENVLRVQPREERDWAIGESIAEIYLLESDQIIFPWNMERDKRNIKGSLPGADIIGFFPLGDEYRFALGEVKSSSEQKYPPQVMSGRNGHLGHQINNLAHNLETIHTIFRWLFVRCKGNKFEKMFQKSLIHYFNSGNKGVSLYGILIRDTPPNEDDLNRRGTQLGESILDPTSCDLKAIYLPCKIADLPILISEGEAP